MKCWHCDSELIWGGDDDSEGVLVTNLSCSECNAFVLVYLGEANEHDCT